MFLCDDINVDFELCCSFSHTDGLVYYTVRKTLLWGWWGVGGGSGDGWGRGWGWGVGGGGVDR